MHEIISENSHFIAHMLNAFGMSEIDKTEQKLEIIFEPKNMRRDNMRCWK